MMRLTLFLFCLAAAGAVPARAQVPPPAPPSGQKVPRFASIKFDRVYARTGPDQSYPIAWVYQRQGLPVEITAEYNDWRHIRDAGGGEGWLHKIQLSPKRAALVQGVKIIAVTDDDDPDSAVVARLEPGVVTSLDKCDGPVCKVEGDGYKGWAQRKSLWGIYPGEDFH